MSERTIRLLPASNIHLERRRLREIPTLDQSFDVLVCAGDIWEGQPEKAVQSVVALARGKPSIIVAGNHDPYTDGPEDRRTVSEFVQLLRNEAERQNARAHRDIVTVLSADDPVCELQQARFIGLTLWTDWAQSSRWITDQASPNRHVSVRCRGTRSRRALAQRSARLSSHQNRKGPMDAL
jgi:hypothetical protein